MSDWGHHKKAIDTTLYPDSGDNSKWQPSDFNAGHTLTGGGNGQPLCRDTSDVSYGGKFTPFPSIDGGVSTFVRPSVIVDGQWWWEASGSLPALTLTLYCQYGGVIRAFMSQTYAT